MASLTLPFRGASAREEVAAWSSGRVLAIVSCGYLLASWAMNPVSAILPTITADLGIDVTRAGWLLNAYFVLLVGWVLIAGRLGDAFGYGRVFRTGCLVFASGSLIAALSSDFLLLLVARAVQGVGSAMLFGTSLALVASAYTGARLGWAVGILTVSSGLSSLIGVWVSVETVQLANWHWSFAVPMLIGLAIAASAGGLPSVRRSRVRDVDWPGGLLLFGALMFLLLGLNHLHEGPETFEAGAPYHLGMHGVALAFLVAFLWRQLTTRRPLIQLRLLRIQRLSAGVVANGIAHSSMLATGLLIPFLLERGRGYSPTETAELLLVQQVSLVIGSFGGGWLYSRRATPVLGVGSIAAIALGLAVLGQVGAGLPLLGLFPLSALLGAGLGVFTAVNNTAVMSSISGDQRGFASGLVETTRQLGHSLGVSIASGVLATSLVAATDPAAGYLQGFSEAASVMGVVAAIGVLVVVYPLVRTALGVSRPAALR